MRSLKPSTNPFPLHGKAAPDVAINATRQLVYINLGCFDFLLNCTGGAHTYPAIRFRGGCGFNLPLDGRRCSGLLALAICFENLRFIFIQRRWFRGGSRSFAPGNGPHERISRF